MEMTLRKLLCMDEEEFCRLLNTDLRTLRRWEAHQGVPKGAALQTIAGLEEAIRRHPERSDFLVDYIRKASAVGGISYLLVRLFDDLTTPWWGTARREASPALQSPEDVAPLRATPTEKP